MRKNFQAVGSEHRHTFTATFERTGYKTTELRSKTYYQPTILVSNVMDQASNLLTDHLWFNYTLGFQKLGHLEKGDRLQFDGRISTYTKGYLGRDTFLSEKHPVATDYKIERPTKIKLLNASEPRVPLPKENWDLVQLIMKENEAFYKARDEQAEQERFEREQEKQEEIEAEMKAEKAQEAAALAAEEVAVKTEGRSYRFVPFTVYIEPEPRFGYYGEYDYYDDYDSEPYPVTRYKIVEVTSETALDDNRGKGYHSGAEALRIYQKRLRRDKTIKLTRDWLNKQPKDQMWEWIQTERTKNPMLTSQELRSMMYPRVAEYMGDSLTDKVGDVLLDGFFAAWWGQTGTLLNQSLEKRRQAFLESQPKELPATWRREAIDKGVPQDQWRQYMLDALTQYIQTLPLTQQFPVDDRFLRRWQKMSKKPKRRRKHKRRKNAELSEKNVD